MLSEFGRAFILTILAEIGDKTQIIAMTFATKYSVKQVLLGVLIGIFFNHGLAIILGRIFSKIIPINYIQIIIGILFIIFGFMSLIDEDMEEEDEKKSINPIMTVGLTFFIGELGDKSQLTAMSLAAEAYFPLVILLGTTLGMIATSGIGIFIGSKLGDKIPDIAIKIISSIVFFGFGSLKLLEELGFNSVILFILVLIIIELYLIKKLFKERSLKGISHMQKVSKILYNQTKELKESLDNLCLGEEVCGSCLRNQCLVGYIRGILDEARENENYELESYENVEELIKKDINLSKAIQSLALIINGSVDNNWPEGKTFVVNNISKYLEATIFGREIKSSIKDIDDYLKECMSIDTKKALELEKYLFYNH